MYFIRIQIEFRHQKKNIALYVVINNNMYKKEAET